MTVLRIAQAQMPVYTDIKQLAGVLKTLAEQAVQEKASFLTLPEMFCCPYDVSSFPVYAEPQGSLCRARHNDPYDEINVMSSCH